MDVQSDAGIDDLMRVLIRADSSLEIGSGHIMRCLTLAIALRDKGAACQFVCRNHSGNMAALIRSHGFAVDLLPGTELQKGASSLPGGVGGYEGWLGAPWEIDAQETVACIENSPVDWIVVDHYGIDRKWENAVRPYCKKIMVIDDLANRSHECDLLLDQNLVENFETRYQSLVPERCPCLLGPKYSLLQADYATAHSRTPPRQVPISRVLVYFGGADSRNLTGLIITAFKDFEEFGILLDVVVNPQSPFYSAICELARSSKNIFLHTSLPSLCHLMIQADVAIGASGATSWERCCLGLPSYVVTLAENQEPIAKELHRRGFVKWLGNQSEVSVRSFNQALSDLVHGNQDLECWSSHCRSLVDGKGASHVRSIMMLCKDTPLNVRAAELKDERLLLEWANDPVVRKNAFNPNQIDAKTHREWFYKRLRNPTKCAIYIVEADDGLPIGQARFEYTGNGWEVHYGLAAVARGNKLGVSLLSSALREFRQTRSGEIVFGQVKLDNLPSQAIFRQLGFSETETSACRLVYTSTL
ncbi:MAG: UDP-2,4-diacetamido-2,4,6-trideoxy-beta-L-altropyranose hydrolase [Planctomycetes bacterium]|nr:UDP-2,4-diacetamido-2,4,6-trideoxy-beta-L-altropyranose hydrolase [Planctomycetota bacterium]